MEKTWLKNEVRKRRISDDLIDQLLSEQDGQFERPRDLMNELVGAVMNRMMEAEMSHHLDYERDETPPESQTNRRNGHRKKTMVSKAGKVDVEVPRDRDGSFEPKIIPKHQRRFDGFDEQIVSMYGRGMTVREIQRHIKEMYGTDVSKDLISRATEAVVDELKAWRNRPLETVYPVVYLDALVTKVRDGGIVQKKAIYLVVGMDIEGRKSVLGMWMQQTEGAKFWLQILTELKQRGVEDILVLCADGLKGMPAAVEAAFPTTVFQTCVVHLIRYSTRLLPWKDRRIVCKELKDLYTAVSVDDAREKLDEFTERWKKYPSVARAWESRFEEWSPFLAFPNDVRRVIYTTNAIEALNRIIRKNLKVRGALPTDDAAMKLVYLSIMNGEKTWGHRTRNWPQAVMAFDVHFPGRLESVLGS